MHTLIAAAGRRSAGLAAGVILTGGMVGGVLLAPGTAYAATATIAITSATPSFDGIDVEVSVTNGTDPLGTFSVSGAGNGCTGNLFGLPGSGSGDGQCTIPSVADGTYTLTASYDGASSSPDTVTVGNPSPPPGEQAPVWSADSPPASVDSQSFSYQFQASGSPTYELSGNPDWLNIDPNTGVVWGTIPDGVDSFTFSVRAWNEFGSIWAGPFTVFVHHHFDFADLETSLSCPSRVFTGRHGSCTLWVTNTGSGSASDVTAQIRLPWQLRADFCGSFSFFHFGCSIFGNTASEDLGTLFPGQTKHLTVVFTAETGFHIFGWHHGFRDTVRVVGSASADGDFFGFPFGFGERTSFSVAHVTIIPRGFWW